MSIARWLRDPLRRDRGEKEASGAGFEKGSERSWLRERKRAERATRGLHFPPPSALSTAIQLASGKEASDARLALSTAIQLASRKEASGASDARLAVHLRSSTASKLPSNREASGASDARLAVTEHGARWAREHCRAYEEVQLELAMNNRTPPSFFPLFDGRRSNWGQPPAESLLDHGIEKNAGCRRWLAHRSVRGGRRGWCGWCGAAGFGRE